jgi:hypothetical protein
MVKVGEVNGREYIQFVQFFKNLSYIHNMMINR